MKAFIVLVCLFALAVRADDNFVAGQFVAVDSVNAKYSPFAFFEKEKQFWDRPPFPKASFTSSRANDLSVVRQLKNGAFCWSNQISVNWYTYFGKEPSTFNVLGNEAGLFTTRTCSNCGTGNQLPPFEATNNNVQQNIVVSNGRIVNIATSGDWVMACGQFNQIGDTELSTPTKTIEASCTRPSCGTNPFSIAVFQANTSTSWNFVWPQSYEASSSNPLPFGPATGDMETSGACASLIGVGEGGDFLITLVPRGATSFSTFRFNVGTSQWTSWVQDFAFVEANANWKVFDQTAYGLTTNIPTGSTGKSLVRKTLGETAHTVIYKFPDTNPQDYGNLIRWWEPGPEHSIYLAFVSNALTNLPWNHLNRYLFKFNSATSNFDRVSADHFAGGVMPTAGCPTCVNNPYSDDGVTDFMFWWDRAQGYLVAWSANLKEVIYTSGNPEVPDNCTHPANPDYCAARQNWYFDKFYAKPVNYVVQLDGSTWKQAYGGGFSLLPGKLTSKLGETNTFAFGCDLVFQRQSRNVGYYQKDATSKVNLWGPTHLLKGVDDDPYLNLAGVVKYARFLDDTLFIAGQFRTIDSTEVYSLATVAKEGAATMYAGGVHWIDYTANAYPWNAWRVPGTVEHVIWNGDDMYISGVFNWVGAATDGTAVHNIAHWNKGKKKWNDLKGGVNGAINDLLWWQDTLYVAGSFDKIGTTTAQNVARWNSKKNNWESLNYGLNGNINFIRPGLGGLVAFGDFTDNVWRWTAEDGGWWHIPVRPANDTCVSQQCTPPASITDVYVLNKVGFMIAGGSLWSFTGISFQQIDSEYSFSGSVKQRQMGFSPSGNLLIWNRNAPTSTDSYGAVEYDLDKWNFVKTIASFDQTTMRQVHFTTEASGEISSAVAQASLSVAILAFSVLLAMVM